MKFLHQKTHFKRDTNVFYLSSNQKSNTSLEFSFGSFTALQDGSISQERGRRRRGMMVGPAASFTQLWEFPLPTQFPFVFTLDNQEAGSLLCQPLLDFFSSEPNRIWWYTYDDVPSLLKIFRLIEVEIRETPFNSLLWEFLTAAAS